MLGYDFCVRPANCDETVTETDPEQIVKQLSLRKASAVKADKEDIVIGSDTIVALDGIILGKPKDTADAYKMLQTLSGKTHKVYTGIAVKKATAEMTECVISSITFKKLTDQEIADYIQTGEPMDKAGAYAIQGKGAAFISHFEGDYFSTVGLSAFQVHEMIEKAKKL